MWTHKSFHCDCMCRMSLGMIVGHVLPLMIIELAAFAASMLLLNGDTNFQKLANPVAAGWGVLYLSIDRIKPGQVQASTNLSHSIYIYIYIHTQHTTYIYIYGNRQNYGKKHVQLRQAAPESDFSIIGFFPIRVQNIPEVIRTFFFSIILGGGHYFHNWFFL